MDETLVACLFFVGAIVLDAATASAPTDATDAPASLRASSIIATLALAAPLVLNKRYTASLQRPVLLLVLAIVSVLGNHEGSRELRCFDSIFVLVVLLGAVYLVCVGGVDEKSKKIKKSVDPVEACRLLAASLMAYAAMRNLRSAVTHATNVRGFEVSGQLSNTTVFDTAGYALADESTTLFATLAASTQLMCAILILLRDGGVAAMPLRATGAIGTFCSLTLLMALGSQADHLQAVFGGGACLASTTACDSAAKARRFAMVNSPVGSLFLGSLGTVVFANVAAAAPPLASAMVPGASILLSWLAETAFFLANFISVLWYCKLDDGNGVFVEYVLLLSIVGLFVARKFDVWLGNATLVALAGFTIYELDAFHADTLDTLTFVAFFVFFGLLCLHALLQLFLRVPYTMELCDAILDALFALALALALAASIAVSCYSGAAVRTLPFAAGIRNAMLYVFVHYIPLFYVVTPGNRISPLRISLRYRAIAWLGAVILVGIVHTSANWKHLSTRAEAVEDWTVYPSSIGAGMSPWLATLLV
jgi:hypothetical protein